MILKGNLIHSDNYKWANVLISATKAFILGTYLGLPDIHKE